MIQYDVVCVGNALVDILTQVDEQFLITHGIDKGVMILIDEERSKHLYQTIGPAKESSGGSAANTAAGIAAFGGSAAYIGKVANDQLGNIFKHDITAQGVHFETQVLKDGAATGTSICLITPDSERTMKTYLGAARCLTENDVDEKLIEAAQISYFEGYLWDEDGARAALAKVARVAEKADRKMAMSLSDPFCVERHRDGFLKFITNHVDILFGNEFELLSLFETSDFDAAIKEAAKISPMVAITRSAHGSILVKDKEQYVIEAVRPEKLIDLTGAGDQYAAGVLTGLARHYPLPACGRLGSMAAAEVIAHLGARPDGDLSEFVHQAVAS